MIPASGAGGHEFDSRIAPLSFFDIVRALFWGRRSKTDNTTRSLTSELSATCLVSSVRQSVRLLIDWPRVRSPHRVLPFSLFFWFCAL
jgi:hypothetical protein